MSGRIANYTPLERAVAAQSMYDAAERVLADKVKAAVDAGVPILRLSKALGVSRSRIRLLAREHQQ